MTGILLVHLQEFYECDPAAVFTSAIHTFILAALAGKAFSLLAICFGFSCHVVAGARCNDGLAASGPYIRRLSILAAIGCVHSLLYRSDVLVALAGVGMLILPLQAIRSNWTLLGLAALCFVQPLMIATIGLAGLSAHPAFPGVHAGRDVAARVYAAGSFADVIRANLTIGQAQKWAFLLDSGRALQMIGFALVGMVLGRIGFFDEAYPTPRVFGRPLLSLACAVAAVAATKAWFHFAAAGGSPALFTRKALAASWSDMLLTFGYLSAFRAMWGTNMRAWMRMFDPLGRMSLSFYIGQSIVFVPVFYHFGAGWCGRIGVDRVASVGVAAAVAQVCLAILWRRHFVYGPLEWLWRAGTRGCLDIPFLQPRQPDAAPVEALAKTG